MKMVDTLRQGQPAHSRDCSNLASRVKSGKGVVYTSTITKAMAPHVAENSSTKQLVAGITFHSTCKVTAICCTQ
jgi:hypothetical protein